MSGTFFYRRVVGAVERPRHVPGDLPLMRDHQGNLRPPTLLIATTVASTALRFVAEQASFFASVGWDVHIACAPTDGIETLRQQEDFTVHEIPMSRDISPLEDVRSLSTWIKTLRSIKPDVVMAGTPKAGMLGAIASRICRVPVRIYLLWGLRAEGLAGVKRMLSLLAELATCSCSTRTVSVSSSLRDRVLSLGLTTPRKIIVLANGSSHGVNTDHFRPPKPEERRDARAAWGFNEDHVVAGFVGRLTRDKGLSDLTAAFNLMPLHPGKRLLIVGTADPASPNDMRLSHLLMASSEVVLSGAMDDPQRAYWSMDVFVLPSYREGLPNVVLEASASGLPVITTTATGCIDSIVPGETGISYTAGDVAELASVLSALFVDEALRIRLGQEGRRHVTANFAQRAVWQESHRFMVRSLTRSVIASPEPLRLKSSVVRRGLLLLRALHA